MPTCAAIRFTKRLNANLPATKFGGQPDWLNEPQWPLSRQTHNQMRFICQIELLNEVFEGSTGQFAYLFMTESEEYIDGTWEPNGGENAVIIQSRNGVNVPIVEVRPTPTGPTIQKHVTTFWRRRTKLVDAEFSVNLKLAVDPAFIPENELFDLPEVDRDRYYEETSGNKVGGTPGFMQSDQFPEEDDEWILLLQLDSCSVPFYINFGDAGIGYAFINKTLTSGRFLWQCA